jgi:hypothetical protein
MVAIRTTHPGEALMKIAAFEIFSYYMRYDRSIKTVSLLKEIVIAFFKLQKMVIKEVPQGGFLRLPPPVYLHIAAAFHIAPLLPAKE